MIQFSEKYYPLFEILDGAHKQVDTVLISGGRDSGKTFVTTCFVPIAAADYNHRILFTRQTMASTDRSITAALDNRLEILGMEQDFIFANNDYKTKHNKGLISITGQKTSVGTETAKLKSLEDYSIFITEEGEELTDYEDWKKTKRSMRAKDVQCLSIIVFNPPAKSHWFYDQFYKNVPDGFNGIIGNIMYIHTDYRDNGQENMAPHNWIEYEELRLNYEYYLSIDPEQRPNLDRKITKDYKNYKHSILGHFSPVADGVVFEENVSFGKYPEEKHEDLIESMGLDFGYSDYMALVKTKVDFKNKRIYAKQLLYKTHLTPSILVHNLEVLQIDKEMEMWCDSADPMSWQNLRENNFEAYPVDKSILTVVNSIKLMLEFDIILDENSPDLIECFGNYSWSKTKLDVPNHKWSDIVDATRYSFIMTYFNNKMY